MRAETAVRAVRALTAETAVRAQTAVKGLIRRGKDTEASARSGVQIAMRGEKEERAKQGMQVLKQ
jgi:hypothetical protein